MMHPKKLTPLEILQEQKNDLQAKSDQLSYRIENHATYLQRNFVPLLRDNMVESAISKMPPHLRSLFGNFLLNKEKKSAEGNSAGFKFAKGIAFGVAEIAPFFLKGKKGAFLAFLLKQIVKLIA
ncbi:MAG: hypothetical protein FWF53_03685 [Candidatus Azobacteroides sp.]|nr:hypothetical protein [Candidatus Azobacteroides sp.]